MLRKALVVLFASLVAATAAADPGPFLPGTEITRSNIVQYMNYYRGVHGLVPLREDARLNSAAEDRLRDMEDLEYFAHVSPAGTVPFVWIRSRGYQYQAAGENLAQGFESTQILLEAWMESPGHRKNILSADFRDVGIGIIDGTPMGRATGKSIVVLFASENPGQPDTH